MTDKERLMSLIKPGAGKNRKAWNQKKFNQMKFNCLLLGGGWGAGSDAAKKMIGSKSIMVIRGLEIFQDNTHFYPRKRPLAIPFPILVDIGSWEESYRKISYFQNLLSKFVKIASIYATKSFQFLKQFS